MQNRIAAIILNYNNYADTCKCVDNILDKCDVEIVIVDNASTNDSYRILNEKYGHIINCHVLASEKNRGYSAGNNIGMKYLKENIPNIEYYTIMNPDTLFEDSNVLKILADNLDENKQIAVIAPVMWMHGENCLEQSTWSIPTTFDYLRRQFIRYNAKKRKKIVLDDNNCRLYYTEVIHGSFYMIRADVIEQIGYLDENLFMYGEENLLAIKIKELGYVEAIALDVRYEHNHLQSKDRKTFKQDVQSLYRGGAHSRRYIWKQYYPKFMLPLVDLIFAINVVTYLLIHIKRFLKKMI